MMQKEGRKKQAQTNKQGKATQHMYIYYLALLSTLKHDNIYNDMCVMNSPLSFPSSSSLSPAPPPPLPLLVSEMMYLRATVRGARIILRLTLPGPSVGSSCQHICRHSSLLHSALRDKTSAQVEP